MHYFSYPPWCPWIIGLHKMLRWHKVYMKIIVWNTWMDCQSCLHTTCYNLGKKRWVWNPSKLRTCALGGFVSGSKRYVVGLGFTLHKWLLMDDHMQVNAWGTWFILGALSKGQGLQWWLNKSVIQSSEWSYS